MVVHIHTHTNVYILSSFNLKFYYEQFSNVALGALDLMEGNTHIVQKVEAGGLEEVQQHLTNRLIQLCVCVY